MPETNRYMLIVERIFQNHYNTGTKRFEFKREEIIDAAGALGVERPKNVGDLLYYFRSRHALPEYIRATAPAGFEWVIDGTGRSTYAFQLSKINRVLPQVDQLKIKIPDATPQIVVRYALNDEQALLAKVRYNRLIDIFLSITSYSLQNHLRTTVNKKQIEIDELYVGVNRSGAHFIVPVQAKGGSDQITSIQAMQDIRYCRGKYPELVCRAVAAQFMAEGVIALFELTIADNELAVVNQRHYKLVPANDVTESDLTTYRADDDGTSIGMVP